MLTPLLLAATLQVTAPAQQTPAQPAQHGQPSASANQAMPGTQPTPADQPLQGADAPGAPPPAAETAQPTPRPDPAKLPADAQFARYDANGDGALDKTEYGSWLIALRTAKDPDFKPEKPEAKAWIDRSFIGADTNRDDKISREEMVRFLTPVAG
ncbi:EF-hand domain-containing protein [Sphingomonas trueperi]|uniref:EF-hand domain-containing protein n=3 Tax=Sphingomonas TaxID=13687 RepID=A0A7X5Y0K7_9SPHN|nr:EF-hand domain-containing protein [Sphingomonas trueperi]NJB98457.1 hypothetical protein [Sphingomonas trueperi]